jgi:predicted RND superfamily exporter protein
MDKSQFEELKNGVQEIIDLIVAKDNKAANNKLLEVSDKLDEFLDHTDEDEDLIEISKYQVLINQLFQKINPEEEGE